MEEAPAAVPAPVEEHPAVEQDPAVAKVVVAEVAARQDRADPVEARLELRAAVGPRCHQI
jgi:hypothetical protein